MICHPPNFSPSPMFSPTPYKIMFFTTKPLLLMQDIEPIKPEADITKFQNPDPLQHPDSDNMNRYILGTRMQSKSGHKGHKRDTCAYHDLDLSIQGVTIKSMVQESMQMVRKFRSIQQDKLREAFKTIIN